MAFFRSLDATGRLWPSCEQRLLLNAALAEGERWAAKYCRLMALAQRTRQAIEQGRIAWDECLAIAKLISRDEAAARSEVEKAEAREARQGYAAPPPESFKDRLWGIHKACGLDVPQISLVRARGGHNLFPAGQ